MYAYGLNGTITSGDISGTSVKFYMDGYTRFNFVVRAKYSDGQLSSISQLPTRSQQLGKFSYSVKPISTMVKFYI